MTDKVKCAFCGRATDYDKTGPLCEDCWEKHERGEWPEWYRKMRGYKVTQKRPAEDDDSK